MSRPIFLLSLLSMMLISCSDDDPMEIESGLDQELTDAINTAPNSSGVSSFILPERNDFNSIPQDPRNNLTPTKILLGQLLFHETAFATGGEFPELAGTYSCASCHHVAAGFQAGVGQGIGEGGRGFGIRGETRHHDVSFAEAMIDVQPLRTPSAMNIAYQTNILWNGQFGATALNTGTESLWPEGTPIAVNKLGYEGTEIQAIAGYGVHRHKFDAASIEANGYKNLFDAAFSDVPEADRYDVEFAGLAVAAYERTILSNRAPFQNWLRGNRNAMTEAEKRGAILFFGKGQCSSCHNGPSLAAMEFHAIGMNDFNPDEVSNYVIGDASSKGRGSFTKNANDDFKFKVPQLYNLTDSPFYGHGASFNTVRDVVEYKNLAIAQNSGVPASQLSSRFVPLNLTPEEITDLVTFIENGLYDPDLFRYVPDRVLSGACFPNNDEQSRTDLGCL